MTSTMKKKSGIIIVILLIALLSGGSVYYLVFNTDAADAEPDATDKLYNYAITDPFITNVKDSSKLFKATIVLVANQKGLDDLLEQNQYTVRDTILFILRDLTEKDIKNEEIQDTLRQSIPDALNEALGIDSIVSVRFSDFLMT